MVETKILAATGMLGQGFLEDSLNRAMKKKPDVIGCDAGSTDAGPYYLATGKMRSSKVAVKRDLKLILKAGVSANIPIIVGSAGYGGANPHLRQVKEIVEEIAKEEGMHFKLALIESELQKEYLKDAFKKGKITPLNPAPEFNNDIIDRANRFVAMMGIEPYIESLKKGAQVIIGGRSSDASIYAALPIMRGCSEGLAWHAAKILECGSASAEKRLYIDSMFATIYDDYFVVGPPNPEMRCTPQSVAAHSLYENSNPIFLIEPSGILDISQTVYEPYNQREVIIKGSIMRNTKDYTVKIEGAELAGYRYISIGGIRDPLIIKNIDNFLEGASRVIEKKINDSLNLQPQSDYSLRLRVYGKNGCLGELEYQKNINGHELGIVIDIVANTREKANDIGPIAWHTLLHHPIPEWSGSISSIAYPFSPPGFDAGPVYRFCVNHVLHLEDPLDVFPISIEDL
jgi:hypothetical protein